MVGTLVANKPVATTPQYTSAAEVADILGIQPPSEAADEGEPTLTRWNTIIRHVEEEIDRTIGTSYRVRTVLLEVHPWTTWINEESYYLVQLRNAPVRTLSNTGGNNDSLELWNGASYEEWIGVKTAGRSGDYWLDEPSGYLYLRRSAWPFNEDARVRISYRYGESEIPGDISLAAAKLAAATLATRSRDAQGGPAGGSVDKVSIREAIEQWRRGAYTMLAKHQRVGRGY